MRRPSGATPIFGVPDPDVAGSVTRAAGTFDGDRVATRCRLSMTERVDGYRFRDRQEVILS
jgi:hypothetical protein